ncbi:phosphodiester glycosidase family protein [Candidatus Poribacteria bacterium]|nr:phosphodiester glycosidase family protein [Candidatus Poribacteria bacterium]
MLHAENNRRNPMPKLIAICGLLLLFIFVINAVRVFENKTSEPSITKVGVEETRPKSIRAEVKELRPKSVRRKDALDTRRWPDGFRLYRYQWVGGAAVYVAEMDRDVKNLRFDIELANSQILRRETITSATRRLKRKGIQPLAGVNGSFGIREDSYGRGGMIFNLHIQAGELVSIPKLIDRWGYSPPSPWGETSFGVTPDGEFLLQAVQLNGKLRIGEETLTIEAVNQICDSLCQAVLYTPRFGRSTLTRRCYEFTLKKLTLPLTGKYTSRFVVTAVNPRGNSVIPSDGVVLAMEPRLAVRWYKKISKSTTGVLDIALTPEKWQTVQTGIGGNLRLLRDGEIEPELFEFARGRNNSAYRHSNAAHRHPRSALGFNDEKLFLIVIDGRQSGYSMGMTLYQMADFFNDIGIKHAINFDGGSSSALWALGRIVNRPAHGYERRIFNVALIRTKEK